jgi:hypothetical protein
MRMDVVFLLLRLRSVLLMLLVYVQSFSTFPIWMKCLWKR